MDTATIPVNDIAMVGLVAVVVQILKPLAEASFLPPTAKVHDPLVRFLAVALGVAVVFVQHGIPSDGGLILSLVSEGAAVGLGAIGGYHVLSDAIAPPQLVGVTSNLAPLLPPQPPTPPDPPRG